MRLVICGGGKVAENLIQILQKQHQPEALDIRLIETDFQHCRDLANRFGISVFHGSATDLQLLRKAGTKGCDCFMAITGDDELNLISCQMAERALGVRNPIARVNDPRNEDTMHRLGIGSTFSSTTLLAERLNQEVRHSGLYVAYDIPGNSKAIVEFVLSPQSDAVGQNLINYSFPGDSKVVLITHSSGEVELPSGPTVFAAGDRVMLVCDREDYDEIHRRFVLAQETQGSKS